MLKSEIMSCFYNKNKLKLTEWHFCIFNLNFNGSFVALIFILIFDKKDIKNELDKLIRYEST